MSYQRPLFFLSSYLDLHALHTTTIASQARQGGFAITGKTWQSGLAQWTVASATLRGGAEERRGGKKKNEDDQAADPALCSEQLGSLAPVPPE